MGTRIRGTAKRRRGCWRNLFALVLAGCLLLAGCGDNRHVWGKRIVNGIYYIDCDTGKTYKDAEGKNTAIIVRQTSTKAEWDKTKVGDPC